MPRQRYVLRDFVGNERTVQTTCATQADGIAIATAVQNVSVAALVRASGPYTLADTGASGAAGSYGNVQDRLELVFRSGQGGVSVFEIPAPRDSGIFLVDQETADLTPNGPVDQLRAAFITHATDSAGYAYQSFLGGQRRRLTRPTKVDAMQLITSVEPLAATPSLAFPAIPQRYYALVWVLSLLCDQATNPQALLRFNGDSGANYQWNASTGPGNLLATGIVVALPNGTGNNPNNPETAVVWLPNYRGTPNKQTYAGRALTLPPGGPFSNMISGIWLNGASITSAQIDLALGNFLPPSKAHLYGLL